MKEFNAPYFPIVWLDEFLQLIKRVRVDKIDRKWIATNKICSEANASKVVTGLKFLKLIDAEGNVIAANLNQLKLEGEPYKAALQKIIKEAYTDLLSKVDITKAYPVDLLNYFISTFHYSKPPAQAALALFLHLASQAGLQLSNELSKRKPVPEQNENGTLIVTSRRPRMPRMAQKSLEKGVIGHVALEAPAESNILISVRGKGISHQQEITSIAEIRGALEVIEKLIELNLKSKKTSEESKK
jgi:hypothetical protein